MEKKLDLIRLGLVTVASVVAGLLLKMHFHGDWWEFAGFTTGVVGVYLVAVEHIVNWPVGLVNTAIYAWVFFGTRLYADMTLQFFFFVLGVLGWVQWAKGGEHLTALKITRIPMFAWAVVTGAWVIGTAVYVPIITHYKGAAPLIDSILTVGSIIAQLLLNAKKLENWILWIVIDAAYIPLYLSRDLGSTAVLYGIFLGLALYGLYDWIRTYRALPA